MPGASCQSQCLVNGALGGIPAAFQWDPNRYRGFPGWAWRGCPSPAQGGDCATHLDTGSRCGRQGIRHVCLAAGLGGDTAALVSVPAGWSEPPGDSGHVIPTQTRCGDSSISLGTVGLGGSGTEG